MVTKEIVLSTGTIKYVDTQKKGPAAVYIHGGFGDGNLTSFIDESLGGRRRIIAPHLPGHGSMDLTPKAQHEDIVSALNELFIALQLSDFLLVGHSYGGRIAHDLLLNSETKIERAVLFAPLLKPIRTGFSRICGHIIKDYLSDLGFTDNSDKGMNTLKSRLRNVRGLWRLLNTLRAVQGIPSLLPCTIYWGTRDSVLPASKYSIPSLSINYIPGGHYAFFKSTALMNKLLDDHPDQI
jgi:pimeloyl-ACP methyl ester carboxylesterase